MDTLLRYLRKIVAIEETRGLADRALLQRFIETRDEAAFAALLDRHAPLILAACRRQLAREQDAEDVLQATFLVLVRKAGSIRNHESVGSWLYGVAYRLARKVRKSKARRKEVERDAAKERLANSVPQNWDDLGAVLDEELLKLPENYRAPLVLCCLQGKSRDEAAQELGWSLGAVKIRLERGRELLRSRLARRGVGFSVALLPISIATAAVPVRTLAVVVDQALDFAAGRAVESAVARELATELLRDMVIAKVGGFVAIAGAVLLAGLGGVWLASSSTESHLESPAAQTAAVTMPPPNLDPPHRPAEPVDPLPNPGVVLTGLLRSVEPGTRAITIRIREMDTTYSVLNNARIEIDGQKALLGDLGVLGTKVRVKVTLTMAGTEVREVFAEGEVIVGTLRTANAERRTITVQRHAADPKASPTTWPLAPSAAFTRNGQPGTLADLRENETVTVQLSADGKRVLTVDVRTP